MSRRTLSAWFSLQLLIVALALALPARANAQGDAAAASRKAGSPALGKSISPYTRKFARVW